MDILIAVLIAVDNQIEVIAVLGYQRDKLLAGPGGRSDVIHQRHVAIGRERSRRFLILHALHHEAQHFFHEFLINGPVLLFLFQYLQVILADIPGLFRNNDLIPFAVFPDHLHLLAGKQMSDDVIFHSASGAQMKIAADLVVYDSGRGTLIRLFAAPFPVPDGINRISIFIYCNGIRLFLILGFLIVLRSTACGRIPCRLRNLTFFSLWRHGRSFLC